MCDVQLLEHRYRGQSHTASEDSVPDWILIPVTLLTELMASREISRS
jgi:hypothetical protein